jgi:hypothetical protein
LNTSSGSVELTNKALKGTPLLLNGTEKGTLGKFTATLALGGKVLPEQRVVDMTCGENRFNTSVSFLITASPRAIYLHR